MAITYLLLGSNQGDREYFLREARYRLAQFGTVIAQSGLYETAAWGLENQADFLNQVLQLRTAHSPENLLQSINAIEAALGRIRTEKYGSRNIDIDILYYDDLILELPHLIIPHPRLHLRRFTLVPLTELAPEGVHPLLKQNHKTLLAACPDVLDVTPYEKK